MIQFSTLPDTIEIRQKPDEQAKQTGLAKFDRSKYPGCNEAFAVAEYQGRYITGIDPDGYDVARIKDPEERLKEKSDRKELLEWLESQLNRDLSATSPFWEDFKTTMSTDNALVLSKHRPIDVISFYAMVANGDIVPSKAQVSDPLYRNCKYYAHFQEQEISEDVSIQKKRDKARAKLAEISEDKDLIVLIGQYLEGPKYNKKLTSDTLYTMLSTYINKDKKQLAAFIKATTMPIADVQFKVNIDTAVKRGIIKMTNKYYQRGETTFGKTLDEVYKTLSKPDYARDYLQITEELAD